MNSRSQVAFSLVELMVVIVIVGLLTAAAAPSYRAYVARARLAEVLANLNTIIGEIITVHNSTGNWPTSIKVNGVTINTGATPNVNWGNIRAVHYYAGYGSGASSVISGITEDIGLTAWVQNTTGSQGGAANQVWILFGPSSGAYVRQCGRWDSSANALLWAVPFDYLPADCQCNNLGALVATPGTACAT